jgi:fatty acid CoA ligase FadD9
MNAPDGHRQPADRLAALMATDAQLRAAAPLAAAHEAKCRPGLNLAQIVATVMAAYAERPALARRSTRLVSDPASGRRSLALLEAFEAISYAELWSRARALAAVW